MTNWTLAPAEESEQGSWHSLAIGPGGYVTGMDIASDGEKVVRTDTYGAYRWNSTTSQWDELITATSMGETSYVFRAEIGQLGVYEIRIAPSNTQRYYMVWDGYVYRTDNRGASWTKLTDFTRDLDLSISDEPKTFGQRIAIDPADPDTAYFGTKTNGVWYTHDAGETWTQIPTETIPFGDADPGHAGLCFDSTSGVNGSGYTNILYVPSYGNGIWRTTNGGSTWAQMSGAPTSVMHAKMAAGVYYCTSGVYSTGTVHKYTGSWVDISPDTPGNENPESIAISGTKLVGVRTTGQLRVSDDLGSTWGDIIWTQSISASDVPWLAWTNETGMTSGEIEFDPISGDLYFCEGIGVFHTPSPSKTQGSTTWTSQSKGIEQLVASTVWSIPGGGTLVTAWDRPVFLSTDPDTFPSTHGVTNNYQIRHGHSVEHARDDISFVVANCGLNGGTDESGYSTDGGATWTIFASRPTGYSSLGGGHIAAKTKENFVWAGCHGLAPYYTTNHGANWTACPSPVNVATSNSWSWNPNRNILCTDGTYFYLYLAIEGTIGVYRSSTGASWSLMGSGGHIVDTDDGFNAKLKSVPPISGMDTTGHLFYTNGTYGGGDHGGPGQYCELFKRSTDGGATWSTVTDFLEVYDFGFGKEKPGGSYPSIFAAGFYNDVFGVWMSDDNCGSWTRLGNTFAPIGSLDQISCCYGDMNVYGRAYVGFLGSGWAYYEP